MNAPAVLDEPLLFDRILLEKVWGGRALDRALGIRLPPDRKIGESWELADREDRNSIVARGRFQGRTLHQLMTDQRERILGRARPAADGRFPLLVKYLDATENLSVQVHPHRAIAHTLPPGHAPKTECWYIIAAERGSGIWCGLRPGVEPGQLAAEAAGPGVVSLLSWYRTEPGQFFFVPGGTIHSIGAGVALVEIQETSDTTYRMYDWGRTGTDGKPRETSVDRALRAVRPGSASKKPRRPYRKGIAHKDDENKRAACVEAEEFAVDLLELCDPLDCSAGDVALIYIVLQGGGRIARSDDRASDRASWNLSIGDTWLVPACLGSHRIEPEGNLRVLQVRTRA
jgi:mannose-6-phosphate isomerase